MNQYKRDLINIICDDYCDDSTQDSLLLLLLVGQKPLKKMTIKELSDMVKDLFDIDDVYGRPDREFKEAVTEKAKMIPDHIKRFE
jgi:hypothetical protein